MEDVVLSNNCRICLCSIQGLTAFDLFQENYNGENNDNSSEHETFLLLREKVEFCCRVQLRQSEVMPSKICSKCSAILTMSFNFGKMCRTSQDYLESLCSTSTSSPPSSPERPNDISLSINRNEESYQKFSNAIKICLEDSNDETLYETVEFNDDTMDPEEIKFFNGQNSEENVKCSNEKDDEVPKPIRRERKPFLCSICGNIYDNKAKFTYHMHQHYDYKGYECEICHKKFRQSCVLANHMRTHTGERPYKCQYCNRGFSDKSGKRRHERIHTNERPYKCDLCNKTFTYSGILKKHLRTHTGERPYCCTVCEKNFAQPHQLKAHLETILHRETHQAKLKTEDA